MPGKRRRVETASADPPAPGPKDGGVKPMSAIAAARLKAQSQVTSNHSLDATPSPVDVVSVASDVEDDEKEPLPPQRNVQLCTWRYGPDYVSSESKEQLTVSLKKFATITLTGCFDFAVLKGAININGANFGATPRSTQQKSTHRAFVPSTHPISVIRGLDSDNEIQFLDCDEPTPLAGLNPLFANIWSTKRAGKWPRSFELITESDADPLKRPLVPELAPDDWIRQVEECASSSSATLIVGPPSSGKSHFARRLMNRYLTGLGKLSKPQSCVFYLDLDASKPTYSPHGQISLVAVRKVDLGPPFTHPSTIPNILGETEVVRAHPFPLNGLLNYIDQFLSCIEDLLRTYLEAREQMPSAPLVINTPGYLYTADFSSVLELLGRIKPERLVHLTNVDSIDEDNAAKLDALDTSGRKCGTIVAHISAQSSSTVPSRTDQELRSMQMLSYFHCRGQTKADRPLPKFSTTPLSHEPPWEFCYEETDKSQQAFIGFLVLGEWVDPGQLSAILNGSIIQIVETEDESIHSQFRKVPRTDKFRIPYFDKSGSGTVEPLDPKSSRLVCTALLRGWDPENRVVQLIVPKTHEVLMHSLKPEKTVFVFGSCETPDWAYTEDAYYQVSQYRGVEALDETTSVEGIELPPWVAETSTLESMAYLNTPRRIRKYQQ